MERGDDVGRLEHRPRVGGDHEPGVVIDHVQDLGLHPSGQAPVGDIGLPPLVGHRGLEPDERAPGSFLRLRADEPAPRQDPPDRRDRRAAAVAPLEVDRDRVRAGIQALLRQLLAEPDDLLLEGFGSAVRRRPGSAGPGLQARLTLGIEPPHELVDPPP